MEKYKNKIKRKGENIFNENFSSLTVCGITLFVFKTVSLGRLLERIYGLIFAILFNMFGIEILSALIMIISHIVLNKVFYFNKGVYFSSLIVLIISTYMWPPIILCFLMINRIKNMVLNRCVAS